MRPSICNQTSTQAKEIIKKCKFCENSHHRGKCPVYGKVYHNCNRKNHFKKCCPRNIKTFETELPSADEYEFFLDTINLHRNPENLVNISKIDTGAQCNVIPTESLENISPKPDLQPVNVKLSAYNGSKIPVVGKCLLILAHKNKSFKVSFIIVDSDSVPILGMKTREHLQLIKRICRIEKNNDTFFSESHDCFGEIGTLNITEVKDNVKPVVTKLEKELKRMVDLGIFEPIKKPTDWVNGKLCICLYPRPLNNAIKSKRHLPTTEVIFSKMSGACFLSKLDASSGY